MGLTNAKIKKTSLSGVDIEIHESPIFILRRRKTIFGTTGLNFRIREIWSQKNPPDEERTSDIINQKKYEQVSFTVKHYFFGKTEKAVLRKGQLFVILCYIFLQEDVSDSL